MALSIPCYSLKPKLLPSGPQMPELALCVCVLVHTHAYVLKGSDLSKRP